MNSKKLERNLKGSLGSSNTTRSIVIDDDGAHATNTKKFSSRCLIGNWPSEKLKEDENLREFLEKRERGELLMQKTAKLGDKFLAPAQLSSSTTSVYVSFDQAIQLIACDMPKIHFDSHSPMALSVVVNEPHINRCQEIDQHCEMSCAQSTRPTARNTFIIRKPTMPLVVQRKHRVGQRRCNNGVSRTTAAADSQYLKYGQDFMLECYDSKQKPLMLYSSPQSPFGSCVGGAVGASSTSAHSDYVFKVHGEMKQSVGLALPKGRHFDDRPDDAAIPSHFFHWRIYHINPDVRYETIGENIPINAKVIVQHGFSKHNLCCEKILFLTIFGMEFGVSCHTEKNIYGAERESNVWEISTKSPDI